MTRRPLTDEQKKARSDALARGRETARRNRLAKQTTEESDVRNPDEVGNPEDFQTPLATANQVGVTTPMDVPGTPQPAGENPHQHALRVLRETEEARARQADDERELAEARIAHAAFVAAFNEEQALASVGQLASDGPIMIDEQGQPQRVQVLNIPPDLQGPALAVNPDWEATAARGVASVPQGMTVRELEALLEVKRAEEQATTSEADVRQVMNFLAGFPWPVVQEAYNRINPDGGIVRPVPQGYEPRVDSFVPQVGVQVLQTEAPAAEPICYHPKTEETPNPQAGVIITSCFHCHKILNRRSA